MEMKRTYLCTKCNSKFTSKNISEKFALKNHQYQPSCCNKRPRIVAVESTCHFPIEKSQPFEPSFDPSLCSMFTDFQDLDEFGSHNVSLESHKYLSTPLDKVKLPVELHDECCTSILQYQHMLSSMYEKNASGDFIYKPITVRRLKQKKNASTELDYIPERNWQDTVDIFNFWVQANVSVAIGDNLLALIQRILDRNIKDNNLKMPSTFRSVKEACTKREKELFPSTQFSFPLPPELYGKIDLLGKPLIPEESTMHDIGPAIGRELLLIDPVNFAFKPDIVIDEDTQERCFGVFSTGTLFESLDHHVRSSSPYPNQDECETVALALAVSSDTTTLDKGQNITGNGMQLFILNVCGISRKPIFLGMIPEKFRRYSSKTLHLILKHRGFTVKDDREKIIAYTLRQMKLGFMHAVLEKTLEYQNTGIYLQVGSSRTHLGAEDTSRDILAFPHTTSFFSDTLEANGIAGVAMRTKFPCRMCLQHDCSNCLVDSVLGSPRDDKEHCQVSTEAGVMYLNFWLEIVRMQKKRKYTPAELSIIEKASSLCIKCGPNPLYKHFSKQNDWLINSLHQALLVDYLHTLWKGLIEFLISQCLITFTQVSRLCKKLYHSNLATLDLHISNFPIAFQTLLPWKMTRFPAGVTPFLKKSGENKQGKSSTGFFSGSIAAWRLTGLLAQMFYSIPQNGSLLPSGKAANKQFYDNANDRKSSVRLVDQIDIQRTVIDAIELGLDVEMIANAPFMKESDIQSFRHLLSNAIYRANKLFRLNSLLGQLKRDRNKKPPSKINYVFAKLPQGIKHHLLAHLIDQFSRVGKDKSSSDTMISEHFNIIMKGASQRTTQKLFKQGEEMSRSMNMTNVASLYEEMIISNKNVEHIPLETQNTYLGLEFFVTNNCSHQDIIFERNDGILSMQLRHQQIEVLGGLEMVMPFLSDLITWDMLYIHSREQFSPSTDKQLRFLRSLKCGGSSQHGIDAFIIHCNPQHYFDGNKDRRCGQQCFGFIKVQVESSSVNTATSHPEFTEWTAMVLAIIEESTYADKESDRIISQTKLCVCWLEEVTQAEKVKVQSSGKQIQFVFKNREKTQLWVDFIETTSIVAPVFVMPITSSSNDYVFGGSYVKSQKEIKFWEMDLERVKFWSARSYDNFTHQSFKDDIGDFTIGLSQLSGIIIPQKSMQETIIEQEWDLIGLNSNDDIDYFDDANEDE